MRYHAISCLQYINIRYPYQKESHWVKKGLLIRGGDQQQQEQQQQLFRRNNILHETEFAFPALLDITDEYDIYIPVCWK